MTSSLRTRLLAGTIGGMVLLLACFSVTVYAVIRHALVGEFDSSLTSTAKLLSAAVEIEDDTVDAEFEEQHMPEFNDAEQPAYYQIWELKGGVVCRSPLLGQRDLPQLYRPDGLPTHAACPDTRTGRPLRAVGVRFLPRMEAADANAPSRVADGRPLVIVVARDASELHGQLGSLKWLLLAATGATAGLALLVAAVVVRRGLGPLQSIAAEIAAIGENDLAARVGSAPVPAEIAPIQDRLNGLLARLQKAFDSERRITADVAHELRTPLAGIRATIEVALGRERNSTEYRSALSECLAMALGMQALTDNLLTLAHLDASAVTLQAERIALAEFVDSIWLAFRAKAEAREISFENRIPEGLAVNSDAVNLGTVFSNLLSNAVEYADSPGRVWITARRIDGMVEIAVANTGCALTGEQLAHVFDRFWRADRARADTGVHCGLGLALVQEMTKALHGHATAEVKDGTFTARVTLPA
ncbi:MAG: sensor histidine kinase N-terminal domain-containing protein [Sedimentisphaerales bacterium]|nr:sensor histidine kinase N-terminal domain-containing protein [Sedimentisphaerales bacterium]